ncbi:hypothetical protein Hanom_Chr07g00659631 [Helianthus anomalus]
MMFSTALLLSPRIMRGSLPEPGIRTIFSLQRISARCWDNQSIPMTTSKLPKTIGIRSIEKVWLARMSLQPLTTCEASRLLPFANSTVCLLFMGLHTESTLCCYPVAAAGSVELADDSDWRGISSCNPLQRDQACCTDDSCPWCMAHCGIGCSDCIWGDSPCTHHDFDH